MAIEDEISFLEQVPLLRRLGSGALRSLAIAVENRSLGPGEVLFNAGEPADGAFIVVRGSLGLKAEQDRDPETVAGPGTLLGETALLTETTRPATATAREPSTVLRLPRAMFLKVLDSYPDAAQRLRDVIAQRTDQWARDMESVRAALARTSKPE